MSKPRPIVLGIVVLLCVVVRLVPYMASQLGMSIDPDTTVYPWNFSPILPLCLFGSAFLTDRRLSFALPFAVWMIGDLGIGLISGHWDWAFYPGQPIVYLAMATVVAIGLYLRKDRSWPAIAGAGFVGASIFFLVSNFSFWAMGTRYAMTLPGLIECYEMAIPFYRNSLISMTLFLPLLFSPVAVRKETQLPSNLAVQPG